MSKRDTQGEFEQFAVEQNEAAPFKRTLMGLGVASRVDRLTTTQALDELVDDLCMQVQMTMEARTQDPRVLTMNFKEVLGSDIREILQPVVKEEDKATVSMLDVVTLGLTEPDEIRKFLKKLGIDMSDEQDLAYATEVFAEAADFFDTIVAKDSSRQLNPSLKTTTTPDGICRVFQTAAGKHQRQLVPQACALLRIAACIDFLNKDPMLTILPEAERQLKLIYSRHFISSKGKTSFHSGVPGDIPMEIIRAELRTKTRKRMIAKLLHKPRNSTKEVVDHVGMRITTKSAFDALRFLYLAFFKPDTSIFPGINIRTEETSQLLLDEETLVEALKSPRKAAVLMNQLATPTIDHADLNTIGDSNGRENRFSSAGYKAISITFDLPIRMPNGKRTNFPFEVQIVDRGSRQANDKVAPHNDYVARQNEAVRRRILGNDLLTEFKKEQQGA